MNALLDGLPTAIEIDENIYEINTDYRTGLKIIMAFEDNELTNIEKQSILLSCLYKNVPSNIVLAIEKGVKFLNCGQKFCDTVNGEGQRIYSFKYDDRYIFSGVDRVLNGRLSKGDLVHWWEFVMAFMELPEDCMMSKIIYYRTQFSKGRLSKEERKVYFDNKEIFELPEELTNEETEKRSKFFEMLENNSRLS